jgi:hypothetical protein
VVDFLKVGDRFLQNRWQNFPIACRSLWNSDVWIDLFHARGFSS